jgi:hypothetical protein
MCLNLKYIYLGACGFIYNCGNNSLFISKCSSRDLPKPKNLRGGGGGFVRSPDFICSHVPMEIFCFYET